MVFCIQHLDVEFKMISDELFSIRDCSLLNSDDVELARGQEYELHIEDDFGKKASLMVPFGGCRTYHCKELGFRFCDGLYCVSVEGCEGILSEQILYYPELRCEIVNSFMPGDQRCVDMLNSLEAISVLAEAGKIEMAKKEYSNLWKKFPRSENRPLWTK